MWVDLMRTYAFIGVIVLVVVVNILLIFVVFQPQLQRIQEQIVQREAIPAGVFVPTFHDYYYEYVLADRIVEGEWQIERYVEVKRIVDENGVKIKDIPTGGTQYVRYFIGEDIDGVLFDLMEEHDTLHGDDGERS